MMCCLSLLVPTVGSNSCLISLVSKVYIEILYIDILLASWYSIYHNCTTSFNQAQTQVLHGFKSCLWSVGDSRWWESLIMVPAGNKVKHLLLVNLITKKIIIIIIITKLQWLIMFLFHFSEKRHFHYFFTLCIASLQTEN